MSSTEGVIQDIAAKLDQFEFSKDRVNDLIHLVVGKVKSAKIKELILGILASVGIVKLD